MHITPKSLENVGGYIFNYTIPNISHNFKPHHLVMEVKDKALRRELTPIFDRFPNKINRDTLELHVEAIDNHGGVFLINDNWLKLLKFDDWYVRGEENIPIFTKLAQLTKLIAQSQDEFRIRGGFMDENIQKHNFKLSGMVDFSKEENEIAIRKRFAKEVTIPKFYDFCNVKKVAGSYNNVIQNQMRHFFDVR